MQSVPIATKVASLNPAHGEVHLIQQCVIKLSVIWRMLDRLSNVPSSMMSGFHITITCHTLEFISIFSNLTFFLLIYYRHELVNVNLKYKPKWIRERYPAGLVPILEKDGRVVYESSVCNDYLDEIYPEPKLTPSDPYEKAEDKMLSETFAKVRQFYFNKLIN